MGVWLFLLCKRRKERSTVTEREEQGKTKCCFEVLLHVRFL